MEPVKEQCAEQCFEQLSLKAYAKINLGLDVLRKRPDGYHDLRMIMHRIGVYDELTLTIREEEGILLEVDTEKLPADQSNLAYRAADLLFQEFQIKKGIHIELKKHIPMAAGLAGGSADAAAVLLGVNELFDLGLSKEELMKRGVRLGADIPYCILSGTALAEGIGDVLTPLPDAPKTIILLAKPEIDVSTAFVYKNLKVDQLKEHPDIDGQIAAIHSQDAAKMAVLMGNVLETVTIPAYPIIEQIKEVMKQHGALNAMMSGSGPTVFGLFTDSEEAGKAADEIKNTGLAKDIFIV